MFIRSWFIRSWFTVSSLCFIALIAIPSVLAVQETEGFESIAAGTPPQSNDLYTYTSTNGDDRISTAQAHSGTKSFRYDAIASNNHASFEIADQCGVEDEDEFTFWVYITDLPSIGYRFRMMEEPAAGGSGNDRVELFINSLGAMTLTAENSANVASTVNVPGTMQINQWIDFRIDSTCSSGSGGVFSATLDTGAGTSAGGTITALDTFTAFEDFNAGGDGRFFYLDDFSWEGPGAGETSSRFCAEPTEVDFGYHYVEGVEFFEDVDDASGGNGDLNFGLVDGFVFEGDSDNSEYLGKGFTTGSRAFKTVARIEAGTDSSSSTLFRIAYTTGAGGLPSVTTKGDGTDGGNFDNHVQARFLEDGNDWVIGIYQNIAGGGLNIIGSGIRYGSPNIATTFNFTVDSRNPATAYVTDDQGNVLISRGIGLATDTVFKDQWFVGKGATGALNAFTALDDNTDSAQNDDSTCIFDLIGESTIAGSEGSTPGSETPDDPNEEPDPDEVPTTTPNPLSGPAQETGNVLGDFIAFQNTAWGLDVSPIIGAVILLIILVIVLAASGGSALAGLVVVIVIGSINVYLGLFYDWMLFLLALAVAAFAAGAFFQIRASRAGDIA